MKFSEVVAQTLTWLQREGRVSYRALRLEFDLTEDVLDALKEELIEVKELAVDKDGKMLVWKGAEGTPLPSSQCAFVIPTSGQLHALTSCRAHPCRTGRLGSPWQWRMVSVRRSLPSLPISKALRR